MKQQEEMNRISRFITDADEQSDFMIYRLPEAWWSRHYEYVWAAGFAEEGDTVLDAACGVCHPFKFFLGGRTRAAYACDMDPRILSREAILADIADSIGEEARQAFDPALFDRVELAQCDMTAMPYNAALFDKVFCISVLEHIDEQTRLDVLYEFARVLKPGGVLVLTVDHPFVDLDSLEVQLNATGFEFVGPKDFAIPSNAVSTTMWGPELKCVRLVLRKERA